MRVSGEDRECGQAQMQGEIEIVGTREKFTRNGQTIVVSVMPEME